MSTSLQKQLASLPSPCYVADITAMKRNLEIVQQVKADSACHILLANKAFSMFSLFPFMAQYVDGTTASGLYEAKLAHEHFGKEIHTYSPAYSKGEIEAVLSISSHLYFNSITQLKQHHASIRKNYPQVKIGLRVNPKLRLVKNSALYDPSAPGSRFGVDMERLTPEVLDIIDVLHVHNCCENMADDSVKLIHHLAQHIPHALHKVEALNLGGGHYLTHADYQLSLLVEALKELRQTFALEIFLEPGGALVYDAGYLIADILDIIVRDGQTIAITNSSATCHMPDVLEVPYTPSIIGASIADAADTSTVTLAGKTCLTGDVIGHYRFAQAPQIGDRIIFTDMMQYTMVKNTTFNGVPLPAIAILHENGSTELVREFSYEDFKMRLS